jgi:hypothetical protein
VKKNLLPFATLMLLAGFASSCYLYPAEGGPGRTPGTQSSPEGCRKKLTMINDCLGPFLTEEALAREAQKRGFTIQRFDYAAPAENAKGECQTRYLNYFIPQGTPKGLFFYFHGGGGDVGSADYTDILMSCADLCMKGYVVADIEYRRGWTGTKPLDQWCEQRDPHTEPAANYERERVAAHLSFDDAELAVRFAYQKFKERYGVLPTYTTGTSFGGTLACYVGYGTPNLAREVNLKGVLNQYGGLSVKDPLYATVPYYGAGGVADDLVPFWDGPTYVSPHGEPIYGTGGLGLKLRSKGVKAYIAATCNMGHSRGAISEPELVDNFLNWLKNPRNDTQFIERAGGKGLASVSADSCNIAWQELSVNYR